MVERLASIGSPEVAQVRSARAAARVCTMSALDAARLYSWIRLPLVLYSVLVAKLGELIYGICPREIFFFEQGKQQLLYFSGRNFYPIFVIIMTPNFFRCFS